MLENASNRELLDAWKEGNEQAAQILVRRYMLRLTALARSRLSRKLASRLDPEDVVMSAWRSFFVAADAGRLSPPADDDLWPLLVTITVRKLSRQLERHTADRRNVHREADLNEHLDWRETVSRDPTPEQAAVFVDEVETLMTSLNAADRDVLTRRLQGDDQAAIAQGLQCSERTVRRSLERIRRLILERAGQSEPNLERTPSKAESQRTIDRRSPNRERTIAQETPPLPVPTFQYGDLLLRQLIGHGGFGKVYRALLVPEGATVAVKFLRKRFWREPRAAAQLIEESRRASTSAHPGIVRHHGWGVTPQGAVFIVMDWVDGENLQRWASHSVPTLPEILGCGIEVAAALAASHAVGLVHGDVAPGNVLRRRDGTFVLTDFGFARSISSGYPHAEGGTPGFLAPEQVSEIFGPVGIHTDVYGLGGLIHFLVTGRPPTSGRDLPEILANVLSSRSPFSIGTDAPDIPPDLARLLARCLTKEPSERPRSIIEVRDSLQTIAKSL